MGNDYSEAQLDLYLELLDRISGVWAQNFPEIGLYSPEYWHLFIGLYKNRGREITKGEAEDFLSAAGIKSSVTKAKVIARAISMGYIRQQKSKVDNSQCHTNEAETPEESTGISVKGGAVVDGRIETQLRT